MNKVYEIVYLKTEAEVRSKLYEDRDAFVKDFNAFTRLGKPVVGKGPDKVTGDFIHVGRNGWDDNDVVLTVDVDFGSGKSYSYQASKRYEGSYEVETKYGTSVVTVTYRWRQIDEFRASLWEKGYDNPVLFESILIRKVRKEVEK